MSPENVPNKSLWKKQQERCGNLTEIKLGETLIIPFASLNAKCLTLPTGSASDRTISKEIIHTSINIHAPIIVCMGS